MGAELVEATNQRANATAHANQGVSLDEVLAEHDPASQTTSGDHLQTLRLSRHGHHSESRIKSMFSRDEIER
jgi:hypothetical protein